MANNKLEEEGWYGGRHVQCLKHVPLALFLCLSLFDF